jgi:hypothetical protein
MKIREHIERALLSWALGLMMGGALGMATILVLGRMLGLECVP